MKPIECASEEALGEVLASSANDPRRAHVRDCPRCRALALSYQGFMAAEDSAAYGPSERTALDAAREQLLGTAGVAAVAPAPDLRRAAPGTAERSWWSAFLQPAFRPALALAAVLIAVVGVFVVPRLREPETGSVVRGLATQPLSLADPRYARDGSVRLVWRRDRDAESYEVRFFSTALDPLGAVSAGPDTSITIGPERLPPAFGQAQPVLYRVAALRGGDEMATSATGTLRRP